MSDGIINANYEVQNTENSSHPLCEPFLLEIKLAIKLLFAFPFPAVAERIQLLVKMPVSVFKLCVRMCFGEMRTCFLLPQLL